jgi:hypothetical protein
MTCEDRRAEMAPILRSNAPGQGEALPYELDETSVRVSHWPPARESSPLECAMNP